MTSDLWSEVKILKSITLHVVCWNIGFLDQGIQIWHHFFIWISWRSQNDLWPLIRGQNFEFKNFAWYMLKFRFFGSRNPKINFFLLWPHGGYQMISDLCSEVNILNSLTLHDLSWSIGFLGLGEQKWHYFFISTS